MLVDTLIDNGVHPKHGVFDQQKSGFHQGFSGNDQTQLEKTKMFQRNKMDSIQWEFQDQWPYIGLIYGRYLQSIGS